MSNRRRGRLAGDQRRRDRADRNWDALIGTLQAETTWCRGAGCEWVASRWYLASQLAEYRLLVIPACPTHWAAADVWVCPPGGECGGGDHYVATVEALADTCLGAIAHGAGVAFPRRDDWNVCDVLRPVGA